MPDAAPGTALEAPADPLRALFDRARAGDAAALNTLCGAMRPRLYRTAWALLRDRDEADDVAQEALVRAVTRRFLFLGSGSVSGWMCRIALNLARNRLRDGSRRRQILEGSGEAERVARGAQASGGATPVQLADEREQRARLNAALAQLNERQRTIVSLRVVAELPFSEVAAVLGISEANARVSFSQAKKKLVEAAAVAQPLQGREMP